MRDTLTRDQLWPWPSKDPIASNTTGNGNGRGYDDQLTELRREPERAASGQRRRGTGTRSQPKCVGVPGDWDSQHEDVVERLEGTMAQLEARRL